jgi:hypothetical protein
MPLVVGQSNGFWIWSGRAARAVSTQTQRQRKELSGRWWSMVIRANYPAASCSSHTWIEHLVLGMFSIGPMERDAILSAEDPSFAAGVRRNRRRRSRRSSELGNECWFSGDGQFVGIRARPKQDLRHVLFRNGFREQVTLSAFAREGSELL